MNAPNTSALTIPPTLPAAIAINGITREAFRNGAVWLMFAVSFFVYVEPAPVDVVFIAVLLGFAICRINPVFGILPMLILLISYNMGGVISYTATTPNPKATTFVVTSIYMAVTAMVLGYYVAQNPQRHFAVIRSGLIVGGTLAAILGLFDYFQVAGLFKNTPLPGRATGTFKDPNVFSTYLIMVAMMIMQGLISQSFRRPILHLGLLCLITLAIFLSFSRGAWMNYTLAAALLMGFTYLLADRIELRNRVVLFAFTAGIIGFVGFSLIMSIPETREMFTQRFALFQYYDSGETGRFGNQLRSIPELMAMPMGYGPLNFATVYGNDPHNTFINAFGSYGWLGGISYLTLIVSTLLIGVRGIIPNTPWQGPAIAVFAPMFSTIFQGVQIDTDHWRHFYWLLGLNWGLFSATLQYQASRQITSGRAPGVAP